MALDDTALSQRRALLKLALGASVAFNLAGLGYAGYRWRSRQVPGPFPYSEARQSHFDQLPITADSIVMLGDSLTDWAEWSELLRHPAVRNRGINSDTVAGVLARAPKIADARPRVVAIMIGVNDLAEGRSVPSILESYGRLLELFAERAPATRVVVQSVLPVNPEAYREAASNAQIQVLNRGLKQLAERSRASWLDVGEALRDAQGNLDRRLTPDGIHLNGAGYARWGKRLEPLL